MNTFIYHTGCSLYFLLYLHYFWCFFLFLNYLVKYLVSVVSNLYLLCTAPLGLSLTLLKHQNFPKSSVVLSYRILSIFETYRRNIIFKHYTILFNVMCRMLISQCFRLLSIKLLIKKKGNRSDKSTDTLAPSIGRSTTWQTAVETEGEL